MRYVRETMRYVRETMRYVRETIIWEMLIVSRKCMYVNCSQMFLIYQFKPVLSGVKG